MNDVEATLAAARLLAVTALVLLAPGLALLSVLRVCAEWPERIVLAFSVSYSWIFFLSIVVPLFGWTVDHAALLTIILIAGLAVGRVLLDPAARRVRKDPPYAWKGSETVSTLMVIAVVVAAGVAGWVIEPPFTGEEALDFASLSRFADGGRITFDNTSLLPETRAVYLVQPYQLALGMIARWSAVDPLIAFIKFRACLAPLCLIVLYALLRRLTPTRTEGLAAFIVIVVFVALEIETWEVNALFPFVRRGTVSAGVLVPALMALCIIATRRVHPDAERSLRHVALGTTPIMLVAATATHSLEMFTLLFFIAAAIFAILTGLDRSGDRKQAGALGVAIAVALGAFLTVHARAVTYRADWEQSERRELRAELIHVLNPGDAITDIWSGTGSLLARHSPLTTAATLGIPALGLAVLRMPATAAVLALATIPLALIYATRAGNIIVALLTSPQFSRDVDPYFMFMGILGVALGLVALAQGILNAAMWAQRRFLRVAIGALMMLAVVLAGGTAVEWLGIHASTRADVFLRIAVAVGVGAVGIAAIRQRPILGADSFPRGFVVLTACLAVPLAIPGIVFGGSFAREANATVFSRFASALSRPDVFDSSSYYDEVGRTVAPPLPVPGPIVEEVRHLVPPRQVVLADPKYSCALVVFIDAYCINPERIYGLFFQTAAPYLAAYVKRSGAGAAEHPFFNADPSLRAEEARLLQEYRVSYILTDPQYAEETVAKIAQARPDATLVMDRDGYRLYRIGAP